MKHCRLKSAFPQTSWTLNMNSDSDFLFVWHKKRFSNHITLRGIWGILGWICSRSLSLEWWFFRLAKIIKKHISQFVAQTFLTCCTIDFKGSHGWWIGMSLKWRLPVHESLYELEYLQLPSLSNDSIHECPSWKNLFLVFPPKNRLQNKRLRALSG